MATSSMETPTKEIGESSSVTTFFLTPSARNICILCHEDISAKYPNDHDNSKKRRLWNEEKQKTQICIDLEEYLGEKISQTKDFQSVCISCTKKVKNSLKSLKEKGESFKSGRSIIERQFLRSRIHKKHKDKSEPPTKKKLIYHKDRDQSSTGSAKSIILTIEEENKEKKLIITEESKELVMAVISNDLETLLDLLSKTEKTNFENYMKKAAISTISNEVNYLCSTKHRSKFRLVDINDLENISYHDQFKELKLRAPLLTEVALCSAVNPRADSRNVMKKSDTLIPSIVNSVGTLLLCRNQLMNVNPTRNMIILRRGKADKMCFSRFQKLHMSLSHTSVLKKQLEIGESYEDPVKSASEVLKEHGKAMSDKIKFVLANLELEIPFETSADEQSSLHLYSANADGSFLEDKALNPAVKVIDEEMELSDDVSSQTSQPTADSLSYLPARKPLEKIIGEEEPLQIDSAVPIIFAPKFVFVGDNVDIRSKPRQYAISGGSKDLHLYNLIVAMNRIDIPNELIGLRCPRYNKVLDIPMKWFLPTVEDEAALKEELKVLLSRDLVKYIDDLKWMKKHVVKHISHQYSKEMSKISQVMPLGLLNCNEAKTEGIIEISQYQHKLVPGNNTDTVIRMLSVGDLLTVERQQNAQEDMRDSATPSSRLEGLIPALADFHSYGNFMEVIWHLLYSAASAMDIGTLFQARNFLNARAVPGSPMKNINACEELLFKYADALLIAAFDHYCKTHNVKDKGDDKLNQELMGKILDDLVNSYVIPEIPKDDETAKSAYKCPYCKCSFKRMKSLQTHIKSHSVKKCSLKDDGVLNYSRNALALCYIAKNFVDARKHGDGERILRLYKFMLLYYKVDGRTKYAYQTLHLLSQVSFLLPPALAHELKWNRFVNTKGGLDKNVELDRHLEHQNKYVKLDLARYQGKITEKSLARCSRSYSKIEKILNSIDNEISVVQPSGRHTEVDLTADVKLLGDQYKMANLFRFTEGRHHTRFPGFPKNYPVMLDVFKFKKWVLKKMKEFQELNIYKSDDIVVKN